MFDLPQEIPNV